ncbi:MULTISPECIES: nitroreductase family deazaflavin-dependent oxidoreductase [Amycolatopsis]|uniref:Nitroreductase n=1 Tax=Amycolatopsis bullii TaxID=941987 RepID=A0ABQ3JVE9_9PSEU|nr:nitroreductase family deazaflavin-dependent oxidoreductase [Amycolatopsis bullii]GHF91484.1 nitroreductase [Amycolatopsis bullii]
MTTPEVLTSPVGWVARQARLYEESGGTKGTTISGAPCLLLDYRGRRSSRWHRTVLIYRAHGDSFLVVASNGGADHHPLWYLSIQENPDVRVRVGTHRFSARARTLTREEKSEVWAGLVEAFAPYANYQRKTSRDIPVVRLRAIA